MREQKNLIRTMKHRMLILAVTALTISFTVAAQDATISLPNRILNAVEVFEIIQKQTSYIIAANNNLTDKLTVKGSKSPMTINTILDGLLAGSGMTYRIDGNYIVIIKSAEQNESSVKVNITRNIAGVVMDSAEEGAPLEGVTVAIMEIKEKQATTLSNGHFLINDVPAGRYVARLTSADGKTIRFREITVPASKDANVTLLLDNDILGTNNEPNVDEQTQDIARQQTKTTAYFVPNTTDNTIRALTDEPKTNLFFAQASQTGSSGYLPKAAVKSNLLYLATTTLNVAVELGIGRKSTLDLSAAYNPFQLQEGGVNHLTIIQPEYRYWFCQRFEKHFVGLHGIYGTFNIGEVTFLTKTFEEHRYDGWGAGAGISYGYHLPMGKRWAWEFTVGAGYVYLEYEKFRCYDCDEYLGKKARHYWGPTKAGISLIFMIK